MRMKFLQDELVAGDEQVRQKEDLMTKPHPLAVVVKKKSKKSTLKALQQVRFPKVFIIAWVKVMQRKDHASFLAQCERRSELQSVRIWQPVRLAPQQHSSPRPAQIPIQLTTLLAQQLSSPDVAAIDIRQGSAALSRQAATFARHGEIQPRLQRRRLPGEHHSQQGLRQSNWSWYCVRKVEKSTKKVYDFS